MIDLKNDWARSTADDVVWQGINVTSLEKWSTTVKIASNPSDLGKWVIKYIVTESNSFKGGKSSWSTPIGNDVDTLLD